MNIIFLTNSNIQKNGWAVVGLNIYNQLIKRNQVDLFTSDKKSLLKISKNSLLHDYYVSNWVFLIFDFFKILISKNKLKPDLIHCNTEYYAPLAYLLSKFYKIPYTISVAGTYGITLPKKKSFYAYTFKKASRLICVSNFTKNRMDEEGILGNKVVINPGYDETIFFKEKNIIKENSISFVGNFKSRKGFDFLLKSLCKISNEIRLKIYFIGEIDIKSREFIKTKNECSKYNIEIEFLKKISDIELASIYRKVKLNILPSKSDPDFFEGFGLIHYESIACGTLTIGTSNSGNEDAIKGNNGFLVDFNDVETLSNIILRTLKQVSYPELDLNNIRKWSQVGEDYNKLFKELINL